MRVSGLLGVAALLLGAAGCTGCEPVSPSAELDCVPAELPPDPGPADLGPVVQLDDISGEAGLLATSTLAAWVTTLNGREVRHLAGIDAASSALVHFVRDPDVGAWRGESLSAVSGLAAVGDPLAWVTSAAGHITEHIAFRTPDERLIVQHRRATDPSWSAVDVSALAGRAVVDVSAQWTEVAGDDVVEHLVGRDAAGNLLVFHGTLGAAWSVDDVSAATAVRFGSGVAHWRRGAVEHLAAAERVTGSLLVLSRDSAGSWSGQATGSVLPDGVRAWVTGDEEHLAGRDAADHLIVLSRSDRGAFAKTDVTALTGEPVAGRPSPYVLDEAGAIVEVLAARSPVGHALVFWATAARGWQALSLTDVAGHRIDAPPVAWTSALGIEHLVAPGPGGYVRGFRAYDRLRTLTDFVARPYAPVCGARGRVRRLMVVLFDTGEPRDPKYPKPSREAIDRLIFGLPPSLTDYFLANSGGQFVPLHAGVHGWYESSQAPEYWKTHDRAGGAFEAADADIDFRRFDDDGNGTLDSFELALVFAHPGPAGGLVRSGERRVLDTNKERLLLDGLHVPEAIELSLGDLPDVGIFAHELGHLWFQLSDKYYDFSNPAAPGHYSVMSQFEVNSHYDAWDKLKLGWARPRLVVASGEYTLHDVETQHRIHVLMDPTHSAQEYFLLENRRRDRYERTFDEGIAVWHVTERPDVYDAFPPPGVSAAQWETLGTGRGAWGRKVLRMIRPPSPTFDDARALWDDSDAPLSLRWADGTPSSFVLYWGPGGPTATVTITPPR